MCIYIKINLHIIYDIILVVCKYFIYNIYLNDLKKMYEHFIAIYKH